MAEINVRYELNQSFYIIKTAEVQKRKFFSIEKITISEIEINVKTGIFYNGFLEEELYLTLEETFTAINLQLTNNIYENK